MESPIKNCTRYYKVKQKINCMYFFNRISGYHSIEKMVDEKF